MITENEIIEFVKFLNETFGSSNLLYSYEKLRIQYRIKMKHFTQTSVYGFVDFYGNVFKAASWSTPAKGVRGHISEPKLCCEKYSIIYYDTKGNVLHHNF